VTFNGVPYCLMISMSGMSYRFSSLSSTEKFVLREIERLFDQVFVLVFHALSGSFPGIRPSYIGRNPAK